MQVSRTGKTIRRIGEEANYMQIYWWFLIPAFFLLIFSDRIDRAVKANRKLRKAMLVILALCSGLLLVSIMAVLASRFA